MAKAKNEVLAPEAVDEALVTVGPDQAPAPEAADVPPLVRARVLCACDLGAPDDVVEVDAQLALQRADVIDTDPAAVAYAESLKV